MYEHGVPRMPDCEEELKVRCAEIAELKHAYDRLLDENSKLGLQRDELLKKNDSLEKNIRFLEGAIDAYRFCIRKER